MKERKQIRVADALALDGVSRSMQAIEGLKNQVVQDVVKLYGWPQETILTIVDRDSGLIDVEFPEDKNGEKDRASP